MTTKNITDYDIQALVDSQVDDEASVPILEAVTGDPNLYNRYRLYLKQKKLLKSWWKDH